MSRRARARVVTRTRFVPPGCSSRDDGDDPDRTGLPAPPCPASLQCPSAVLPSICSPGQPDGLASLAGCCCYFLGQLAAILLTGVLFFPHPNMPLSKIFIKEHAAVVGHLKKWSSLKLQNNTVLYIRQIESELGVKEHYLAGRC